MVAGAGFEPATSHVVGLGPLWLSLGAPSWVIPGLVGLPLRHCDRIPPSIPCVTASPPSTLPASRSAFANIAAAVASGTPLRTRPAQSGVHVKDRMTLPSSSISSIDRRSASALGRDRRCSSSFWGAWTDLAASYAWRGQRAEAAAAVVELLKDHSRDPGAGQRAVLRQSNVPRSSSALSRGHARPACRNAESGICRRTRVETRASPMLDSARIGTLGFPGKGDLSWPAFRSLRPA
jgi:hypothetical protein